MDNVNEQPADYATLSTLKSGANWFFWLSVFSVINSLVIFYSGVKNSPFAFGITQWVDGTAGGFNNEGSAPPLSAMGLIVNLLIAAGFAGFGYFARKGNDLAFVFGMFLYVIDSLLVIGLKDFFGFAFHVFALFFLFRGLLASRHARENATTI